MRLNLARMRRLVRRALARRAVTFESRATKRWIVWPEEDVTLRPAIFPDGSLDRITGLSPWRTWEQERPLIAGGRQRLGATRACIVPHVDIAAGCLYAGPAREQAGFAPERWLVDAPDGHRALARGNLVTTFSGSHFFGPYLIDDYPLELLGDRPEDNVALAAKPYSHDAGYRALLDLPRPIRVDYGHVGALTLFFEPPNNASKAERLRTLRARLRQRAGGATACPAGVYLKRGATGERRILENEAAVEDLLGRAGFDIVEPAGLSTEEIVRRMLDAPVIVSIEGSHLSHVAYTLRDEGTLVVLQPADRFALNYKELTDCLGAGFGFLVCDASAGGFTAPLDQLRRMLDQLWSERPADGQRR